MKIKVITLVALLVNVVLLAFLIFAVVNTPSLTGGGNTQAFSGTEEDDAEAMGNAGVEDDALEKYIENLKVLADKHNVNAYFLQELFPENIVYKFRGETIYAEVDETLPQHSYSWDKLEEGENGVLSYSDDAGQQGIFGIDVSKHQGPIDWQKVKDAGVQYVFLRVGYRGYGNGEIKLDEYFEEYIEGATEVGLPIGVYFFSQAVNAEEAVEEAEFVLEAIQGYELKYPIVFDMEEITESAEYRTQHLTAAEATDIAIAFCERIKQAGHHPMIYGNVSWFMSMQDLHRLSEYDLWFAQYRPMPWFPYKFTMWQYSHTGRVDGIEGDVDMNLCFVDYAA